MIVIDTVVIDKFAPTDPSVEMLVTLARVTNHRLYLPAIAWAEYYAHHRRALDEAYEALLAKARDLQKLAPHWRFDAPGSPAQTAAMDRNTRLQERFTPIPTPDWAPAEGLRREIERIPPAHNGDGARDTAIWLAALTQMAASQNEDELLIFYSKNIKDFAVGKTDRLHPTLMSEVRERLGATADRFRYCSDLEPLLRVLDASRIENGDVNRASVAASTVLNEAMVNAMANPSAFFELASPWSRGLGTLRSGQVENMVLVDWDNVHRMQVADIEYLTFSGTWTGEKTFNAVSAQPGDTVTNIRVTFRIDATIVAELGPQSEITAVTVGGLTVPRDIDAQHVVQFVASL